MTIFGSKAASNPIIICASSVVKADVKFNAANGNLEHKAFVNWLKYYKHSI